MVEVEHETFALLLDEFHRLVELCSAVATATAEDVTRDATRMHAHEKRFTGFPIAFEECNVFQTITFLAERNEAEIAIFGGHAHFFAALDEAFLFKAIGDEVFDGDDFESLLSGKLFELWHTCHGAVFVEDFNQASHGLKSCQARQVNSGFGVSSACEYTTILRIEGIDVSRTSKPFGTCFGVSQSTHGGCAVVGGNACGAAFEEVDGHGERRAEHGSVALYLVFEVKLSATLLSDGCTQHATSLLEHVVDLFGRDELRSGDEVTFVFAVFIIDNDEKFPGFEVFQSLFYGGKLNVCHVMVSLCCCVVCLVACL